MRHEFGHRLSSVARYEGTQREAPRVFIIPPIGGARVTGFMTWLGGFLRPRPAAANVCPPPKTVIRQGARPEKQVQIGAFLLL